MERIYRMKSLGDTVDRLEHESAHRPIGVAELREWVVMWESDDGHHRRRYKDKNIARNAGVAVAVPAINWNVLVLHDPRGAYPVQMQCWDCKRVARVMDRCAKCHRAICERCFDLLSRRCLECSV